jgi:hypothetical protein
MRSAAVDLRTAIASFLVEMPEQDVGGPKLNRNLSTLFGFVLGLVYCTLEVADALTQSTANIPEFAWPEDDQND